MDHDREKRYNKIQNIYNDYITQKISKKITSSCFYTGLTVLPTVDATENPELGLGVAVGEYGDDDGEEEE